MRWKPNRPLRIYNVSARVTQDEQELFLKAAEIEEREFSDWIRRALKKHATRVIEEHEKRGRGQL